jgi:hypothetical protein
MSTRADRLSMLGVFALMGLSVAMGGVAPLGRPDVLQVVT